MQTAGAVQKKRIPHWVHILAQIIVAGFCIYWYFHVPVPNKAVLILTGVTVVIALLDMHPGQKAVYLVLVMCLMFIENRAINRDRAEVLKTDDNRRREETANFQVVLEGIKGTIENSQRLADATMARLNATLDRVGDSIKTQTGGDSFAFVTFTPEPNQQFLVAITSRGKYPLREIHVTMIDEERRLQAMQEFNKHPEGNWIAAIQAGDTYFQVPYLRPQSPEGPSGDVEIMGAYPFGAKDTNDLTIAFSSLNGYWNERLHLRRMNGKWHQALSLMGPTVKQALHPFIYSDSDYPEGRALAEKDWPRAKP
jgi:hypothetical protein